MFIFQIEPPPEEQEEEPANITYCLPNGQIVSVDENDVSQTDIQSQSSDSVSYVNPAEITSITNVDKAVIENDDENVAPDSNTEDNTDSYAGIKIGNKVIKISTTPDTPGGKRKFSEINIGTGPDSVSVQENYSKTEEIEPPAKIQKVEVKDNEKTMKDNAKTMKDNEKTIAEGLEIAKSLEKNKRTNLSALNLLTDRLRKLKEIDKGSKDNARNTAVLEGIVSKLKQYKATIDKQDNAERLKEAVKITAKKSTQPPALDEFEPPEIVCNIGFVMKTAGKSEPGKALVSTPPKKVEEPQIKTETESEELSADSTVSAEAFEVPAPPEVKEDSSKSGETLPVDAKPQAITATSIGETTKPESITAMGDGKPYSYTKQTVKTGSGKVTVMRTTKSDLAQLLQELSKNQSTHKVYTVHCQSDSKSFIDNIPAMFKGPNKPNVTVHVVNNDEHKKALTEHLAGNKNVSHKYLTVNKKSSAMLSKSSPIQQKKQATIQPKNRKYQQYTITNDSLINANIQPSNVKMPKAIAPAPSPQVQGHNDLSHAQFTYTNESIQAAPVTTEATQQFTDINSQNPLVISEPEVARSQEQLVNQNIQFVNQAGEIVNPKSSLRSLLSGNMFKTNPVYTIKSSQPRGKKSQNNIPAANQAVQFQAGDKTKISPELEQLLRSSQFGVTYNNGIQNKNQQPQKKAMSFVSPEGIQYMIGSDGSVQCIPPSQNSELPANQYLTSDGQVLDQALQGDPISDQLQLLSDTAVQQQEAFNTNTQSQIRYVNEKGEEIQNVSSNQVRYVTEDGQEIPNPTEIPGVRYVNERGEEVKAVTTADGKVQYVTGLQDLTNNSQVKYVTEDGREIPTPAQGQNVRFVNERGEEIKNFTGSQLMPSGGQNIRFVNEKGEEIQNITGSEQLTPAGGQSVRYVNERGEEIKNITGSEQLTPAGGQSVRYVNERGEEIKNIIGAEQLTSVGGQSVRYVNERGEEIKNITGSEQLTPAGGQSVRYVNERGEEIQNFTGNEQFEFVNTNSEPTETQAATPSVQYVNEKGEIVENTAAANVQFVNEKGEIVQNPATTENISYVNERGEIVENQGAAENILGEAVSNQNIVQYMDENGEIIDAATALEQLRYMNEKSEGTPGIPNISLNQNVENPSSSVQNALKSELMDSLESGDSGKEDAQQIQTKAEGQIIENNPNMEQYVPETDQNGDIEDQSLAQPEPSEPVKNLNEAENIPSNQEPDTTTNEAEDNMPANQEQSSIDESQSPEVSSQSEQDVKYIVTETGDVLYIVPKEVKTVTTVFQQHKYEISVNADRQFVIPVGHDLQCITTETGDVQYIVPNNEESEVKTDQSAVEMLTQNPDTDVQDVNAGMDGVNTGVNNETQSADTSLPGVEADSVSEATDAGIRFPSDSEEGVQVQYVSANGDIQYFTSTNQELVGLSNQDVPDIANCQDV